MKNYVTALAGQPQQMGNPANRYVRSCSRLSGKV